MTETETETETETIYLGGGHAITLPSKPGHRWELGRGLDREPEEAFASLCDSEGNYFRLIRVPIEPAWTSIPEGTLCRITLDTKDAPIVRLAWRKGCSFSTDELGLDGTVQPKRVLAATPLRVLADDEIAIKRPPKGDNTRTVSNLCEACADALEAEVAK